MQQMVFLTVSFEVLIKSNFSRFFTFHLRSHKDLSFKTSSKLGMVAHACNLATQEVKPRRTEVQDQPKKKVSETPS
jgi:hypothetical protein